MSFLPFLIGAAAIRAKLRSGGTAAEQQQYAEAGGVATEVLTLFRTVVAFGTEKKELARYEGVTSLYPTILTAPHCNY